MSTDGVADHGADIYTEPDADPDTLANLGPLSGLAGTWEGVAGTDVHPIGPGSDMDGTVVEGGGGLENVYVERYDLQPIDPQTNGPQLFYGLRYHVHIVKPGEVETFHDQVGYWLWEPAANAVTHTIAIPRGQVVLASGPASADATTFEVTAALGSEIYGILSNPFLDAAFKTLSFRIRVTVNGDGTWSYDEDTVMQIPDRPEPFHHTDRHTLARVAAPTPNPLAAAAAGPGTAVGTGSGDTAGGPGSPSLGIGDLRGSDSL
jgi:hypothetical protein